MPQGRRYTLTHNDVTGELRLTVGIDYNMGQISGFYTRLLRDEVVAEWRSAGVGGTTQLHIYCHVSGEEKWLAPPLLRNYIFRREMPLVLESFLYADRQLLESQPQLSQAEVLVHFQSDVEGLDSIELWGILGERSTWQAVPVSILQRLLFALVGRQIDTQVAKTLFRTPSLAVVSSAAGDAVTNSASGMAVAAAPSAQAPAAAPAVVTVGSAAAAAVAGSHVQSVPAAATAHQVAMDPQLEAQPDLQDLHAGSMASTAVGTAAAAAGRNGGRPRMDSEKKEKDSKEHAHASHLLIQSRK